MGFIFCSAIRRILCGLRGLFHERNGLHRDVILKTVAEKPSAILKTMSDSSLEFLCAATGRLFATAQAAVASESRFHELQAACAAGSVPELRKGDVIYTETSIYLSHGRDDFRGGLAEVLDFGTQTSRGKPVPFVKTVQESDTWQNWQLLAAEQPKLRDRFGKAWAHPDPDDRPEFNE